MSTPIKHISFDLDGTLLIQTPEFHAAHDQLRYQSYADITGLPFEQAKAAYDTSYAEHGSNSTVFRVLGKPSDYWQILNAQLDETKFFKPDPDTISTLKHLRSRVPISIFTNAKPDRILRCLRVIEVDPSWFSFILSGDDIPERKPAPDGFHALIERAGVPAANLLYVGDRVDVDIKPAKALGIQTALVYDHSTEADFSITKFTGLLALV